MKILVDGRVIRHKCLTGTERYTAEILKRFDRFNLEYKIALPPTNNRYLQHIWEHVILPFKTKGYDLLFCPGNIAPVWKLKDTKIIVTIHDLSFVYFAEAFSKPFGVYYKMAINRIIKIADGIITVSSSEKDSILRVFPSIENKIFVVYNGLPSFLLNCPVDYKKDEYILYVGSLNPRKNLSGAIKAFYKIKDLIKHNLMIIGSKESNIFRQDIELKQIVSKVSQNRIHFVAKTDDDKLMQFYRKASLLIFPSFYEGFGLPALEAMACGCPVVTSNISSLPEVCQDAAYYVNPYDIQNIADGIYKVLTDKDLRKSMITKGLERSKLFSWDKTASETLKVFEKILQQ